MRDGKTAPEGAEGKSGSEPLGWAVIERVLENPAIRVIYLWGPPGVGKTYAAYHTGCVRGKPYAVTLMQETPAAELRGHYLPVEDRLEWRDGPIIEAMREGARLVLNEICHSSAEVLSLLYPVLESVETARLTLPTNETVRPSPGFQVVVTDNLPPDELPEALQDRFEVVLHVATPHPAALAALHPVLRRAAERCFALEPERRVSLRKWLNVDRLRPREGLELACMLTFGAERGRLIHDAIRLASTELGKSI